jgi:hypothetical protein
LPHILKTNIVGIDGPKISHPQAPFSDPFALAQLPGGSNVDLPTSLARCHHKNVFDTRHGIFSNNLFPFPILIIYSRYLSFDAYFRFGNISVTPFLQPSLP